MTDSRKIAIYLRLSIEDDALDGKASTEQRESNSISNQRKMLLDYIRNDAELMGQEVAEFCDDGRLQSVLEPVCCISGQQQPVCL